MASQAANTPSKVLVLGTQLLEMPKDLYIPPDALEVFLATFEGPLDLLLYLIKKQNLDILTIPIARITDQYISYIELMNLQRLELAAEYLLMAALLAEIKSKMLLPRREDDSDEEDPRAFLIAKLQEYEKIKKVAEDIDRIPRYERDVFVATVACPGTLVKPQPQVELSHLAAAFAQVLHRAKQMEHLPLHKEPLSLHERMTIILAKFQHGNTLVFSALFTVAEGRAGVVVSFLAILELCKEGLIDISQSQPLSRIIVRVNRTTQTPSRVSR